jgi:hypothetical protein
MRIHGQRLREEALKRRRQEAAKKAWKTRRRLAKVSPTMRGIMKYLVSHGGTTISLHYHGSSVYYISLHGYAYGDGRPKRITRTTFRAMEKRGWLEYVKRTSSGGTMGALPNGEQGIVVESFDLHYQLSEKGRNAFYRTTQPSI